MTPPSNATPDSLDHIVEVTALDGAGALPDAAFDLLIEVPHGATRTADFTELAERLTSPLPAHLVDFFHVNTDAGAPELAQATAAWFLALLPESRVLIVRSRIPRTFIDCNRRIDASPAEFKAGGVTPGLMPWVTTPEDRALVRERFDAYVAATHAAASALSPTGLTLLLHSYAPRTLDVEVDEHIVSSLRAAYATDKVETWPLRPTLDVIARDAEGHLHLPEGVLPGLQSAFAEIGLQVADSATYPMHPSTLAWDHAVARPGRVLCLEVRRDLLAAPFVPFEQMRIGVDQVARLAAPLAAVLRDWSVSS